MVGSDWTPRCCDVTHCVRCDVGGEKAGFKETQILRYVKVSSVQVPHSAQSDLERIRTSEMRTEPKLNIPHVSLLVKKFKDMMKM